MPHLARPTLQIMMQECPRRLLAPGLFVFATPTTVEEADAIEHLLTVELDAVEAATDGNTLVAHVRQSHGERN